MLPLLHAVLRAVLPAPADFVADVVVDCFEHVPAIVKAAKDPWELDNDLYAFFEDVIDDLPFVEEEQAGELATGCVALVNVIRKACKEAKPRPWRRRKKAGS